VVSCMRRSSCVVSTTDERGNGMRFRRGGFTRLPDIRAHNFAKRAGFRGAVAPSGGRFVGHFWLIRNVLFSMCYDTGTKSS